MDEREKRALETVFRHFEGSKLGRSQSMPITTTEMGDIVILTSKYKFQMVPAGELKKVGRNRLFTRKLLKI